MKIMAAMTVRRAQLQQPPPQHEPPEGAIDCNDDAEPVLLPTDANTLSMRTALSCPSGHVAGLFASDIGRRSSKTVSHVRHLNSYSGMR